MSHRLCYKNGGGRAMLTACATQSGPRTPAPEPGLLQGRAREGRVCGTCEALRSSWMLGAHLLKCAGGARVRCLNEAQQGCPRRGCDGPPGAHGECVGSHVAVDSLLPAACCRHNRWLQALLQRELRRGFRQPLPLGHCCGKHIQKGGEERGAAVSLR